MYYPRFTKDVIHHFIAKDKTISMRNRLSMHTAQDDCVLSTMRFVSKSEDCQVYRALLPEVMPNQKMQNSIVYKTYLAYATRAATPKKARKFKKPASPSTNRTLVTVEEGEPEPARKVVLDEPKGKLIDTSEGTGLKLGVPDVSKADSSESEYESWGESGDEANVKGDDEDVQDSDDEPQHANDERTNFENQETNDDEEETNVEFVHTPPNYVPMDDETNDESNDVDKEEYDRIGKELYGDVNVRLTNAEQDDKGEEDADMTDVAHVQVEQTQEQTTGIQEESGPEMASVQALLSKIKSEVPNSIKEYLGTSLYDALYKVLKKHDADNIKEFSVPTEIVERLTQQY
ncbi:hypothetical protein Tco_0282525 [Tanacetum coccineum]